MARGEPVIRLQVLGLCVYCIYVWSAEHGIYISFAAIRASNEVYGNLFWRW